MTRSAVATGKPEVVLITQEDEDAIRTLAERYNQVARSIVNPVSSLPPLEKLRNTAEYAALLEYGDKLLPYVVRQRQVAEEAQVLLGSRLAGRKIRDLEDLYTYQRERRDRLLRGVSPWLEYFGMDELVAPDVNPARWWESNRDRFVFRTRVPLIIDTEKKYETRPNVATERRDGLLTIDAVHATYRQMIERAAAEMNVPVFIGEQQYMGVIGTVRMRSVTFEEFAFMIGRTVYVRGFAYQKVNGGFHFGGQEAAEPRRIMGGWGIKMHRTVFRQGEQIRAIIITRGTDPIVDPRDPAFAAYGSFQVRDDQGLVAKDYHPLSEAEPKLPLLQRKKDCSEITVAVDSAESLEPGEYTMTFRFGEDETPSIAFEVYPASKEVRSSIEQPGGRRR